MLAIDTGCKREPVFPSKIPQSGPAADAANGEASHAAVAADAMSAFLDHESSLKSVSEDNPRGSNDSSLSFFESCKVVRIADLVTSAPKTVLVLLGFGTTNPFDVWMAKRRKASADLCLIMLDYLFL
mmetsp:Transcript_33770/g.41415  ORF Transcript_33770/g.41415 Transcript_33770/m.41415 type:complete len:127 (-) Transcript_33770:48-428(-)